MSEEELFQQYEEAVAKIDQQAHEAREAARATLREGLKVLRTHPRLTPRDTSE